MGSLDQFRSGIIKNNGVFVLCLGLCPTLAVTTTARNGLAMGLATSAVLICSNFIVSFFRGIIPREVRIPCFIVIIASFVTMVELGIKATSPALGEQLGIFIPLIVVNCLILGRAEGFASKNSIFSSISDGAGVGLGFALALGLLGSVREILGSGTFWGIPIAEPEHFVPASIMIQAPGAFLALGFFMGFFRWWSRRRSAPVPRKAQAAVQEGA